jgi:hypothetical protein
MSSALRASPFQMIGSGDWGCGFYPGPTGYGTDEELSFTTQDAQRNPISGQIGWGNPHASPPCVPGLQPFSDTVGALMPAAISGSYTYSGHTYSTIPASSPLSPCIQPGCSISITSEEKREHFPHIGYLTPSGTAFLDLYGTAVFTSSSFGMNTFGGNTYFFSQGAFALVPEPAEWSLIAFGALTLFVSAGRKHKARI